MTATRKPKRQRVPEAVWREIKAAYFVGGELRALAREAGLNENTLLHRAMREGWSEARQQALEMARQTRVELIADESTERPNQSLSISREGLLTRHAANMLRISSRLSDYAAELPAQTAFAAVRQIDVADRLTRRQLGLDRAEGVQVNLSQFFGPQQTEPASEAFLEVEAPVELFADCRDFDGF